MGLIATLRNINRLFPKPPVHTEKENRDLEKRIVSRYSQGNASLQSGRYITTEDVEKKRARIASYKF